jgi:hypothetical protein
MIEIINQIKGSMIMTNSKIQLDIVGLASVPHHSLFEYKKNQIIGKSINRNNNRNIRFKYTLFFFILKYRIIS